MTRALDNSADTCGNANAAWRGRKSAVVWNCNQTVIGKVENKHPPLPSGSQNPRIRNKAREVRGGDNAGANVRVASPSPVSLRTALCYHGGVTKPLERTSGKPGSHWMARLQKGKRDGWVKESRREGFVTAGAAMLHWCFVFAAPLLHFRVYRPSNFQPRCLVHLRNDTLQGLRA